jgi:hypothetical protein
MNDRTTLRASAVTTLQGQTDANYRVYSPRDWPTQTLTYPAILVRTPGERKQNISPRMGPPEFDSIITLTVLGRVEATSEYLAETALEALSEQIENALLTNGYFIYSNQIQQFASVDTSMDVRSESEMHYGECVVNFQVEIRQVFGPVIDAGGTPIAPSLTQVTVEVDNSTGTKMAYSVINLTGA